MSTSITSSIITDGQKEQVRRLVEDAVDRVFHDGVPDKDGAQKLIANGDDLEARCDGGGVRASMAGGCVPRRR